MEVTKSKSGGNVVERAGKRGNAGRDAAVGKSEYGGSA